MAAERAVVVGAGSIAQAWFPVLKDEGVDVVAVVDLNLEAAKNRIEEFELGAVASSQLTETLKQTRFDFVIDLTVPEARHSVVSTALKAGHHVLSEKPMAGTLAEARELLRLSEETNRLFMISQNRRWQVRPETVRRMLISDDIGFLTTINCDFYVAAHFGGFRDQMASPLILDMAIHHFDLVRFMTGKDPVAVYAKEFNPKGSWYAGNVSASCIFDMTEDVVFNYRGSWCAEGCHTSWNGNWRFVGNKGTLLYENDQPPRGQVVAGNEGFMRPLKDLEVPEVTIPQQNQQGTVREMLEFLRTGRRPQAEASDNIKSLAMVFAAIESAARGERVLVNDIMNGYVKERG